MKKNNKKEKVDFSLNVSAISTYTDQVSGELIRDAVLRGRTLDIINVQGGIKQAEAVNLMGSTLNGQAGACGWNESGSTPLTQRNITVCPIKVNESICLDTLEKYWTNTIMKEGSFNESMPPTFEQKFSELKRDQISALVEDLYWKGDTASGATANLRLCNGILKTISTEITVVTGTTSAVTSTNAVAVMDVLIGRIPTNIIADENLVAFMGYDMYRTVNKGLRDANNFNYSFDSTDQWMSVYPGTNVKMVAVPGLNATGNILITPTWNLIAGVDLQDESDQLRIFFDENDDEVRVRAKLKIGAQCAYPQYIVKL
jgi:hypothetical protein